MAVQSKSAVTVDKGLLEDIITAVLDRLTKGVGAQKGLSTAAGAALDAYKDFVPESDFRSAYSELIKAIWTDPTIQKDIEDNPRLLKQEYNFPVAPKNVRFATAVGIPTADGYDGQQTDFTQNASGTVTIYVPPLPDFDQSNAAKDVSICCCCCPCCSST
jgi:hypothetical protein